MSSEEPEIAVEEEQIVPSKLEKAIESGEVVIAGQPKVLGSLVISIVAANPSPAIDVQNNGMNPYMIPTLLRQLAQNFEDSILGTRSLIE